MIEDGNDEADAPPATLFGFPKPRLGMLVSADHRLPQPMHATLGESCLQSNLPDTCLGVIPKGNELPRSKLRGIKPPNPETFVLRTAMARQFGGVDHRVSWVCTACGP